MGAAAIKERSPTTFFVFKYVVYMKGVVIVLAENVTSRTDIKCLRYFGAKPSRI